MHPPTGFDPSLTECGEQLRVILRVAKDGLAPIFAIRDSCPAVALVKADGKRVPDIRLEVSRHATEGAF